MEERQKALMDFSDLASDFLSGRNGDGDEVAGARKVMEAAKEAQKGLPSLERYREVRDRMGKGPVESISPPNFFYTIRVG